MRSSDIPDGLILGRHLERRGWTRHASVHRVLLGLVILVPLVSLSGLLGQRPSTTTSRSDVAKLSVYAPSTLRGGLLFTVRFRIDAYRRIQRARLILDPGWIEEMQVNSVTPSSVSETSRDGKIVLDLGPIAEGQAFVTFIEFQVNPTNIGHRSENVELDDGSQRLLQVEHAITVFP